MPRRWLGWSRFSLRSLMLLAFCFGCGFGLWYRWEPFPELMVLRGHDSSVTDARFMAGNRIVSIDQASISLLELGDSAGRDNTVNIWDANRGTSLLKVHGGIAKALFDGGGGELTLSPNQKWLHVSSHMDIVHSTDVWNAESGQVLRLPTKLTPIVMAISPDDRYFVYYDHVYLKPSIFDSTTCAVTFPQILDGKVNACGYMPDGKTLLLVTEDGQIRFWNEKLSDEIIELSKDDNLTSRVMRVSPNGEKIVIGNWNRDSSEVIDRKSGRVIFHTQGLPSRDEWSTPQPYPMTECFNADGSRFYTWNYDSHQAYIWDSSSGTNVFTFSYGADTYAKYFAFSPDGKRFVASEGSHADRVWSLETGAPLPIDPWSDTRIVMPWLFSKDGTRKLTYGQQDGSIHVFQRRRPDAWWGIAWLPESWLLLLVTVALVASVWRNVRKQD